MNKAIYTITEGRIIQYANALGYEVNVNSNTYSIARDEMIITAPTKARFTSQAIIGLLHELGHAIQSESTFSCLPSTRINDIASILELEFTAWQLGWDVAIELHLNTPVLEREYLAAWSKFWVGYAMKLPEYPRSTLKTLVSGYKP